MRLQVSACGVALLLAGCASLGGASGWRIVDSAFDGLENAKLVHRSPSFDLTWEGRSPFGHEASFGSPLAAGETIHLAFRAQVGPQVELTLAHERTFECADAREPGATNTTVDDEWATGYVLRAEGECVFHLTLRRDVVAGNGIHLHWEATTIAFDERDRGPGGGAALRFVAERSSTSIQNS